MTDAPLTMVVRTGDMATGRFLDNFIRTTEELLVHTALLRCQFTNPVEAVSRWQAARLPASAGQLSPDPILSVSVVTYNSRHCLPAFLASLQRQRDVSWELFFFDNASRDGTGEVIRQEVMGELIISKENLGYGRAHNRNVVRCRGAYLLFLNPDLEFGPNLFSALVGYLEQHPEHGLAGPRILEGDSRQEFPAAPFLSRRRHGRSGARDFAATRSLG